MQLTTTTSPCCFFQILLLDESHRTFFMETGKQMITGIMVKANKVKHFFMLSPTHTSHFTLKLIALSVYSFEKESQGLSGEL